LYNRQTHESAADTGLRELWLPGLVGCLGLLVALAGWSWLIADRRAQLLHESEEIADETRQAIELALSDQLAGLRALADLWQSVGPRAALSGPATAAWADTTRTQGRAPDTETLAAGDGREEQWAAIARQSLRALPGLSSVAWVSPNEPGRYVVAGVDRMASEIDAILGRTNDAGTGAARVTPLSADGSRYSVVLSIDANANGPSGKAKSERADPQAADSTGSASGAGVLLAWSDVAPLLDDALRARARGHAVWVRSDAGELYARGRPPPSDWQIWWRVEYAIALPLGGEWRAVHRPTAEFATARLTPTPHFLLGAGLILSIALALLTHRLELRSQHAKLVEASSRELERRGQALEARVADRTVALQEAVAELEAFSYSVSHDLRSPLGAILNFAAILEEDYGQDRLDAAGRTMLARIRRSALRANALLDGLLLLSRTSRAPLEPREVDMTALAREAFAQAAAAQNDRTVEIVIELLPTAIGDRALLGDVFSNLFSNALKYSRGQEKRRITVTGYTDDESVSYEVADTGRGFDMRFVAKIFGLFERLHTEENIEGTGVGLAMVARIVRRHSGRTWAEGRPGEGAIFSFSLPRHGPSRA
jgi:signal transduction histidine kinase